jgi:type IV pilus assembly protein PilC
MAQFSYKAIKANGEGYEGTLEAPDRFTVYRHIKKEDGKVVSVTEIKSKTSRSMRSLGTLFSKVKTHEKIIFARNLAAMLEAGLSVTRALSVMEKQSKNKKLQTVLSELNTDVSRGESLSDSMKKKPDTFSPLFISMVKAGEESGSLVSSLGIVSVQMEKSYQLSKKIRGALMYPAVIFGIMIIIGILMLVYMVPTLTATFEGLGVELPMSTQMIILVSDFLRYQYLLALSVLLGVVFLGIGFAKSKKGKRVWDAVSIRIPIIGGIVKEVNAARTARTLSSLLSSGVDVVVAVEVTRDVLQNSYYREVLEQAGTIIQKGEPMSSVFIEHEHLYPVFVGEMMSVGEETGKMGDMLMGVASFYEDEVDQKTKDMSTIIEPFLMVMMGVAVGFFAISMLAPTYSLVDAI